MTLGASNISFGLPDRDLINYAFISAVIAAGATSLIVNVAHVRPIVLAADLVMAQDKRARRYIDAYRKRPQPPH
jgi:5-methyltetrahydrofolate--homocysteine methyltransferase